MAGTSVASIENANEGTAADFRRSGSALPLNEIIMRAAHSLWDKTNLKKDRELSTRMGTSDRACRDVLKGGEGSVSGEALANLLRSEEGFKFLSGVMACANPKWWVLCSTFMEVADAQRLQAAARRKIKHALESAQHADADITAAISRAEALAIHDPEFMRPHTDAQRAAARAQDRTVGAAARGSRR